MSAGKTWFAAALAAAAIATASASVAQPRQETGFYAGASIGQSQIDVDCAGTTSCDDTDTSWKLYGGYRLNHNFAIEAGYGTLGELRASTPAFVSGGLLIPAADVRIETSAWEVVGLAIWPVNEGFSVFGKLGLYGADTDIDVTFAGVGTVPDTDDNIGLTIGIGARYDFTRTFGVRADWQRYSDVNAADFGKFDADVLSVGIVFRFQ